MKTTNPNSRCPWHGGNVSIKINNRDRGKRITHCVPCVALRNASFHCVQSRRHSMNLTKQNTYVIQVPNNCPTFTLNGILVYFCKKKHACGMNFFNKWQTLALSQIWDQLTLLPQNARIIILFQTKKCVTLNNS